MSRRPQVAPVEQCLCKVCFGVVDTLGPLALTMAGDLFTPMARLTFVRERFPTGLAEMIELEKKIRANVFLGPRDYRIEQHAQALLNLSALYAEANEWRKAEAARKEADPLLTTAMEYWRDQGMGAPRVAMWSSVLSYNEAIAGLDEGLDFTEVDIAFAEAEFVSAHLVDNNIGSTNHYQLRRALLELSHVVEQLSEGVDEESD